MHSDCKYFFCAGRPNAKSQYTVIVVVPIFQTRWIIHQKGSASSGKARIYTSKLLLIYRLHKKTRHERWLHCTGLKSIITGWRKETKIDLTHKYCRKFLKWEFEFCAGSCGGAAGCYPSRSPRAGDPPHGSSPAPAGARGAKSTWKGATEKIRAEKTELQSCSAR